MSWLNYGDDEPLDRRYVIKPAVHYDSDEEIFPEPKGAKGTLTVTDYIPLEKHNIGNGNLNEVVEEAGNQGELYKETTEVKAEEAKEDITPKKKGGRPKLTDAEKQARAAADALIKEQRKSVRKTLISEKLSETNGLASQGGATTNTDDTPTKFVDNITQLNVSELKEFCKAMNISNYSSLNRKQLLDLITEHTN